ncbi:hypothetical protein J6590_084601, partial [Homalodisca vitripennis]
GTPCSYCGSFIESLIKNGMTEEGHPTYERKSCNRIDFCSYVNPLTHTRQKTKKVLTSSGKRQNYLRDAREVGAKKPSPTTTGNKGIKGDFRTTTKARWRAACKFTIAQRSPIQAAAKLDLHFTFLSVKRLEFEAVTDLTPGIWRHVPLKRSKNEEKLKINSLHHFDIRDT